MQKAIFNCVKMIEQVLFPIYVLLPVVNILLVLKVDGGTELTSFSNTKENECLLNGSSKEDLR